MDFAARRWEPFAMPRVRAREGGDAEDAPQAGDVLAYVTERRAARTTLNTRKTHRQES